MAYQRVRTWAYVLLLAALVLPLLSTPTALPRSPMGLAAGHRAVAASAPATEVAGVSRPGGPAVAHGPDGEALPQQPRWVRDITAQGIAVDLPTYEPTLGIDASGVVYAHLAGDDGIPAAARSADAGATWTVIRPELQLTDVTHTWDPYLHVDVDTGRVFTANLTSAPGLCHEIRFTDDGGEGWTSTALCSGGDHQTLFTGPPVRTSGLGYPNLVYYCMANGGYGAQLSVHTSCFLSRDGGLTFLPSGDQAFLGFDPHVEQGQFGIPGFCDGLTGHGTVGPDGTVYLPRVHCDRPMLAISRDEGLTWERVQVGPAGTAVTHYGYHSHDAGIAVDEDGTLYYTWIARDRLPYLATSDDGGRTWAEPIMVAPPGLIETSMPGAIDVVAPGRVALAYVGSSDSPGPPFPELLDCTTDAAGCFETSQTQADPPGYEGVTWHGYVTVVDVAPDPRLVSARVTPHDRPLTTGACGPFRCKAMFDFIDVAVSPDRDVWAVFVDDCAFDVDGDGGGDACQDTYGRLLLGVVEGADVPMPSHRPGRATGRSFWTA